jgi:cytoskeletal protein CcmA (bactofilin family)
MKQKLKYILVGLALLLTPSMVFAKQMTKANVIVPADETIDGNFYAAGEQVVIDGTVLGDVIVAGGMVQINGTVAGDVIAAGGQIRITGPVQGDVRVAGGDVILESVVGKNLTLMAGNAYISPNAAIGLSALVMAGNVDMHGLIERDLTALVGALKLNGTVNGNVDAKVGEPDQFYVQSQALIGGDLKYKSPSQANVLSGATIEGSVDYDTMRSDKDSPKAESILLTILGIAYVSLILFSLVSLWLVGALIIWLVPKHVEKVKKELHKEFWGSFARGFITLLIAPIVLVILGMSGIGFMLALILGALLFLGSLCAIIHVSTCMGEWVLKKVTGRKWRGVSPYWSMLLGVFIFVFLASIPFVGWILKGFMIAVGFGALLKVAHGEVKRMR